MRTSDSGKNVNQEERIKIREARYDEAGRSRDLVANLSTNEILTCIRAPIIVNERRFIRVDSKEEVAAGFAEGEE